VKETSNIKYANVLATSNLVISNIRHIKHFFGVGVAGETYTVCDDKIMWAWTNLHIKVYLGPWIWLVNLPVSGRRKAVKDEQVAKDQQVVG